MIMAINSRMASAVHILCVVAWFPEEGTTSDAIARSLKTNPVVVRRLLKSMEKEGLVKVRRGRNGGVELARSPQDITLDEVYRAVESEDSIFSLRDTVNERCPVARGVLGLLPPVFAAANSAVEASLNRTTLASLMTSIG
jgi:Rrf2 family protein